MSKRNFQFFIVLLTALAALLFAGYGGRGINNGPTVSEIEAPEDVKNILRKACYDCHSNETKLAWFDKLPIISIAVRKDVEEGRRHLNFSVWDTLHPSEKRAKLWDVYNVIRADRMPLMSYLQVHPKAHITIADRHILKAYIDGFAIKQPADSTATEIALTQYNGWTKNKVARKSVSPNGIEHIPAYKTWQVMSTTSRFDNGTMRVLYANPIAAQAIQNKNINPWPKGSIIVKAMWQKLEDKDGQVRPGKFINLQYMVKDKRKYRSTGGWGFARFDGLQLKPYGDALILSTECIDCHKTVEQNDFVFNLSTKQQPEQR
ncbi:MULTISPECIES: heme-binding domain-containing protein [Olivibacter]|uniref:Heme-binding domain-containing protein n=2 Tax=Olivibacter TaxID=376469 RepID=A0ABV6HP53_9SPHI